jgi:hypothetical protein
VNTHMRFDRNIRELQEELTRGAVSGAVAGIVEDMLLWLRDLQLRVDATPTRRFVVTTAGYFVGSYDTREAADEAGHSDTLVIDTATGDSFTN